MEQAEGQERVQPRSPVPDFSALLGAADQRRRGRGLVAGDDPELDGLRRRAAALISSGDAGEEQVAAAIAAYERRTDAVDINFEFINRKLRRVDRRIRELDQDSPLARELTALSRQALGRAMSGDYDGANALLNRLLDRLPR